MASKEKCLKIWEITCQFLKYAIHCDLGIQYDLTNVSVLKAESPEQQGPKVRLLSKAGL